MAVNPSLNPVPEDPLDQNAWEDWRVLQDVLEERDREYWAEAADDDD